MVLFYVCRTISSGSAVLEEEPSLLVGPSGGDHPPDLGEGARMLRAALDSLSTGVLIIRAGTIWHANQAASDILARRDAFAADAAGRLNILTPLGRRCYGEFLGGKGPKGGIFRVDRSTGGSPYGVRLWRTEDGHGLVIADPDTSAGTAADLLCVTLGISAASARVVAALAAGEDMTKYTKRVGISINTVRYHLKQAFMATGTHSRADLVRVATGFVRDLETVTPNRL